ncbi:plasmid mobilization protein [Cohaesibacter haloalkalitolerans]|uniref:plasmid mobilization protein n=1 Tax=Cohaesibacter haloalkalitolerans TaxID=1162980 RepID=UPI001968AE59|nr:ribbon-helix-helix protein, CopG family [Cohaesibacter haloalkalitolerans]
MSEKKTARKPVYYTEPCEGRQTSPSNPTDSACVNHLTKVITIRCTAAEKEKLIASAKAQRKSTSELLRDALGLIESPRRTRRPPPKVDQKLLVAINAIGTNCNQIARGINAARRHGDMRQLDAINILTTLVSLDRQLASIRLSHSKQEVGNDH